MRIHSDAITIHDVHAATTHLPGVYVTVTEHGSRSRARAFEVSLSGNGYLKNTGNAGAGYEHGATWGEWGVFLAGLFSVDPDAFAGSAKHPAYASGDDYHWKTGGRFEACALPEDTHKRHNWRFTGIPRTFACTKCSAEMIG